MELFLKSAPPGVEVEQLPHYQTGWRFSEESIFNSDRSRFAFAYNMSEATMMNCMGVMAWGTCAQGKCSVRERLQKAIYCWTQPFGRWLTDDVFVFRVAGDKLRQPLVLLHWDQGFEIVEGSDDSEVRPANLSLDVIGKQKLLTQDEMWIEFAKNPGPKTNIVKST